ncbi:hypothetical protein FB451DRAFT_1558028 [Mycena latifolia]|nr:hypothetical protein FB451DRAFT_1558028 [Mycena latifolia]
MTVLGLASGWIPEDESANGTTAELTLHEATGSDSGESIWKCAANKNTTASKSSYPPPVLSPVPATPMKPTYLWLLTLFSLEASAVLRNFTVDDATILDGCSNCIRPDRNSFDAARLNNGTVTEITGADGGLEIGFNGTALYAFFLVPALDDNPFPSLTPTPQAAQCHNFMDGVYISSFDPTLPNVLTGYNILGYKYVNSSGQDADHIFVLGTAAGTGCYFDYAIFTQDVDDLDTSSSSSAVQSTTAASGPGASTAASSATTNSSTPPPLSTATSPPPPASALPSKKRANPGAIAGGVVGGIAAVLAFVAGVFLYRRSRRNKGPYTPDKEDLPGQSPGDSMVSTANPVAISSGGEGPPASDPNAAVVAAQLRKLTDQVEQLARRGGRSSVAESDLGSPTSLGRSLSTMKRDQTLAVRNSQPVDAVRDSLVHTDSGLRLAVGRVEIDEVPPSYEAE